MLSRRGSQAHRPSRNQLRKFDPQSFLTNPGNGRTILHFASKHPLFSQGESADSVFYILEGKVRLDVTSWQGKEATIGLLGPGDFAGEGCLASDHPVRLSTATPVGNCSVLKIAKEQMARALHEEHALSHAFVVYMVDRHNHTQADLVDLLFNFSEKRLARALLKLAHFGKDGTPQGVIPFVSQEALAAMIGTTRSRVNFFMNKFRKAGLIEYNGELKVHIELLRAVLHE